MFNVLVAGLAIALAVVTCVLVVVRYKTTRPPPTKIAKFDTPDAFISWLEEYERWYTSSSITLSRILIACRVVPLVLGFIVAIVSALPPGFGLFGYPSPIPRNIVVIALTGISAVCVALLTQLGVGELATARELGRIGTASLVTRARISLFSNASDDEKRKEMGKIKDEIFKLEYDQAALFAASIVERPPK
jgi:hypothetical protein